MKCVKTKFVRFPHAGDPVGMLRNELIDRFWDRIGRQMHYLRHTVAQEFWEPSK